MTLTDTAKIYVEVTKPKIWSLLVFTALGGLVVAARGLPDILTLILGLASVTLGSAASNTITNYNDRDIDAIMSRTKSRPIPSQRIAPPEKALYYGLSLAVLSVGMALALNVLAAILMVIGILDNVVVYSKILKRRSPTNIILGGISGGMPVMIGYAAVTGTIDLASVIMAALVVLWIPTHIWSLALHSKDDYVRANIPMLPVVVREAVAVRCIASTTILMVVFSVLPFVFNLGPGFGIVYLVSAAVLGVLMFALNFWLVAKPTGERAWVVFKFSSPYLALLFIGMMVDAALIH
ncbi:MAG: protoheme IX farnesyltransferase [Thaumarchaeota archaeon]|nr:protoheme IX farnesyltransferase [Nitrososphaerota archaeon]